MAWQQEGDWFCDPVPLAGKGAQSPDYYHLPLMFGRSTSPRHRIPAWLPSDPLWPESVDTYLQQILQAPPYTTCDPVAKLEYLKQAFHGAASHLRQLRKQEQQERIA